MDVEYASCSGADLHRYAMLGGIGAAVLLPPVCAWHQAYTHMQQVHCRTSHIDQRHRMPWLMVVAWFACSRLLLCTLSVCGFFMGTAHRNHIHTSRLRNRCMRMAAGAQCLKLMMGVYCTTSSMHGHNALAQALQ